MRNLSEKQFEDVFNSLKNKTNNFTEISPELVIENNQYLLILRICLGLTQAEFGNRLNRGKNTIRHIEAMRRKILAKKISEEYSFRIDGLLKESKISLDIASQNWCKYLSVSKEQSLPVSDVKLKNISKMGESDLENYFAIIKNWTDNFTKFYPDILIRMPQSLVIFRIVLGMDHRKFASRLGIDNRAVRKYEHGEMKIKSFTAKRFIKIIENLFEIMDKENTKFENVLENFRTLSNFYGHRNLEAMFKRGLEFAKNHPMSDIETRVSEILKSSGINFEVHGIVEGAKRRLNVDFIIPSKNPKIVIETTSFTIGSRKLSHHRTNICHIDHRFQMLKIKDPKLVTIMILKFTGRPIFLHNARKLIDSELLNTDYLLINDDIEKLPEIIKNMLDR